MKERPIIFSGAMVCAILAGKKTQTRRLARDPYGPCPYGVPGDRLWVRETWGLHRYFDESDWLRGRVTADAQSDHEVAYRSEWGPIQEGCHWRPSIYMPRWASRILLQVMATRCERLQEITEEDARAEGCTSREHFRHVWQRINAGRAPWADNPWVWVVNFCGVRG